jgi:hypothetical protein
MPLIQERVGSIRRLLKLLDNLRLTSSHNSAASWTALTAGITDDVGSNHEAALMEMSLVAQ